MILPKTKDKIQIENLLFPGRFIVLIIVLMLFTFILYIGGLVISGLLIVLLYQLIARLRGAPVVIAHQETLRKALTLLDLQPGEVLYDLGSGNGKVLFYAEKTYKVQAIGIEASLVMILYARFLGMLKKSTTLFLHGNFMSMPLKRNPDAIYLFLMKPILLKMDRVFDSLPEHTRIVSPVFEIQHPRLKEVERIPDDHFSKDQYIYLYKVK